MKELKQQFGNALLMIVTVALVVAAAINFQQQSRFHLPDDGVTWIEQQHGSEQNSSITAVYVAAGSPGQKAGIRKGDELESIADVPVQQAEDVTAIMARLGAWKKADYKVTRDGVEVTFNVIIGEAERDSTLFYQYAVGLVYLAIGLFVYFRRVGAARSLHFFFLCLASFVLSTFHYSGKLNNFDKIIYLGNLVAGFLAPTLFLHFCCMFPEPQKWIRRKGMFALLYVPGAVLLALNLGFVYGWLASAAPLLETRWLVDRVWLGFLSAMYLAGGAVLTVQLRHAEDAIVRRQLVWLRNGAVIGILPFTLFYVIPFIAGVVPTHAMNLAVLSLPFIPLTWAYAILRYRLMDVDIIFQEGYVYTLATLCVVGVFYGLIFSVRGAGELSGTAMVALILIAAFVFQPIRNWIQEQMDRYYFYKDRYDYRRTLIEFARELGSPTDLGEMLETVADRIVRTLGIRHVAFFVHDENDNEFKLELASNRQGKQTDHLPYGLDLSFLESRPDKPYLFFERTRNMLDVVSHHWPVTVRRTIAELDLTYYLPCAARGRTIAYLGVGRTETGDFLSSDDVELLITLSGYVGIAIDNAMLYRSLENKVEEYERLKEFSENIVESIHVGILAADLEGRVESWNPQMEKLTGVHRGEAVGRYLRELLDEDLCLELNRSDKATGIHNIYKFPMRAPRREAGAAISTVNVAVAPLVSKEGSHIGRLIIFDDVTDRDEMERRLIQTEKLSSIGLLAAGVAHEVNTPLAVISTYAQMLAKQIAGDAEKAPLLEKIAKQTFRASEIVNSLLNFSRTATTEFVGVDLNKVLTETLTLIEHQLAKASIEVKVAFDETLPRVKGNTGKLQQIFLNLFLNARDAMEAGGVLAVKTQASDGVVRVTVADSGSGIAPEHLARVFDPFFTTKAARRGTGLGLSVTYGIVKEHNGEIEVNSEVGAGTRFVVTFPEMALVPEASAARTKFETFETPVASRTVPAFSTNAVSSSSTEAAKVQTASVQGGALARADGRAVVGPVVASGAKNIPEPFVQ
jgi:two-component system, NtrC family, sensor kinase